MVRLWWVGSGWKERSGVNLSLKGLSYLGPLHLPAFCLPWDEGPVTRHARVAMMFCRMASPG